MSNKADELLGREVSGGRHGTSYEPDWSKVRGTFLKFAREVDEIKGDSETPNAETVYTRWLSYMKDRIGGDIILWTGSTASKDSIVEKLREFFKDNEEFRSLVIEKWEQYDEDDHGKVKQARSGSNSDDDGGGDNGGSGSSSNVSNGRGGLSSFANKHGTTDSVRGSTNGESQATLEQASHGNTESHSEVEQEAVDDIRNEILLGNVYEVLDTLPSNSVDAVVTSPPYYNVRDYDGADGAVLGGDTTCDHTWLDGECKKCGAWKGQLGNEPEPEMFVDHLAGIFMKIKRVLKPTGSLWINIDDKYAQRNHKDRVGARRKSLSMVPERLFTRLVQNGFLLRDKTLWIKQIIDEDGNTTGSANPHAGMDRLNNAWEPMYRFTLQEDYFFDLYPVMKRNTSKIPDGAEMPGEDFEFLGNISNCWRMQPGRTNAGHFAVFSEFLPRRPIQTTVPRKCCAQCLTPYERKVEKANLQERDDSARGKHDEVRDEVSHQGWRRVIKDHGLEKQCNCDEEDTKRGIVLEPFTGRGTTLKVASDLNRDFVGVEISEEYLEIAHDFVPETKQAAIGDW